MRTFTIDSDDNITAYGSTEELGELKVPFLSSIRMSLCKVKTVGAGGMWETLLLRFPRAVGGGGITTVLRFLSALFWTRSGSVSI